MYTRKPKDMTKFLVNLTSTDTFHTWQSDDPMRQSRIGVASGQGLSLTTRKLKEARRQTVGAYNTSQLANSATASKRDIASFTKQQRQKLTSRLEKDNPSYHQSQQNKLSTSLQERPIPTPSLYRRPGI